MAAGPGRSGPSRRRLVQAGAPAAAGLALAACGAPIVVERVVAVPKIVEREVVVERPVIIEREVIVEKEVVVEREVVVTRLVTSAPTSTSSPAGQTASVEPAPAPVRATLRAAISPAFVGTRAPDLSGLDATADLRLDVLDASGDQSARLLARAAAGELPDLLVGVPGGVMTALDALAMLSPLDAALGAEHEFLPEMLELGRRERGLVGMPVNGHATYLLAGRRRLDQAGVAEVGTTYDALGETARRLTDPETYRYGFGVVAGLPELETVAGSAGAFPAGAAALTAWQWYADQWLQEGVSPPPSAWDGQGGADEALVNGRIAMAIAHGRALSRLAVLPPERRTEWAALPVPSWASARRRVPMASAFVVAGPDAGLPAAEAAVALAGPAGLLDSSAATPAWSPALEDARTRLGLDLDGLLEARGAWAVPIDETAAWQSRGADLDGAVHLSLTLGQPAAEAAADLQAQAARANSAWR